MAEQDQRLEGMRGTHICVSVPDYEAAKRWWADTFGFELVAEWPYGDMRHCAMAPPGFPAVRIEISGDGERWPESRLRPTDLMTSLQGLGFSHFGFDVDDIDAAASALRDKGVEILVEPFEFGALKRKICFFFDPWGNVFELVHRPRS